MTVDTFKEMCMRINSEKTLNKHMKNDEEYNGHFYRFLPPKLSVV